MLADDKINDIFVVNSFISIKINAKNTVFCLQISKNLSKNHIRYNRIKLGCIYFNQNCFLTLQYSK